ncbi:hypothetical protein H5V44_06390 [Halobellus sp. MBLA0160]|uniref:Type II toxin-antitoxin system RelE/ParE family toxin n=1 Tax=Halobellus ruber TaxID=2761102 RepID=A0A7J9SIG8_9EURY|nr:hypothetical protein [Halobellus ruber]
MFTGSGEQALNRLETRDQERIKEKLTRIATCDYRHPTDWDFKPTSCHFEGEGRFGAGDLRVFVDIDEERGIIRIYNIGRRENLYT